MAMQRDGLSPSVYGGVIAINVVAGPTRARRAQLLHETEAAVVGVQ